MFIEIIKFIIYSVLIVLISKYILVKLLRKIAENLNLKAKTIGNITGYATSIPEFLTVITSSLSGLAQATIYNVLSSNIINLIQYLGAIILNKNVGKLKNKAIQIDLFLVFITIIIPIAMLRLDVELELWIILIFVVLYVLFRFLDGRAHELYLQKEDREIEHEIELEIEEDIEKEKGKKRNNIMYFIFLFLTGILLFIIGELLGKTLERLSGIFNISESIIGILLGFMTSIPELITFFEAQKHHKNSDEMLGVVESTNNLLTSNLVNLFIIQAIATLISFFVIF